MTPPDSAMSGGSVLELDDPRLNDARDRAREVLDRAQERTTERGGEVETGDPAETILEFLQDNDVDHVVIRS
jgi:nucleotide-binding universal stress UspA family protein